jgi:CRISPR-associated protein Cmr3
MTLFALDPLDTLFFRDGKPFSLGEETWANGLFPPPLSVVYGALRTAYLSEHIDELTYANGDHDRTSRLIINFFAYYGHGRYYYPCPLDIVKIKDSAKDKYSILEFDKKPKGYGSSLHEADLPMLLQSKEIVENSSGLIDELSLNDYLLRNSVPKSLLKYDEYLKEEPKVGIGRNDRTKTSDEGMLYRVGMKRLHRLKLVVGYRGITISGNLMRFGGEGKSVSVSVLVKKPNVQKPEKLSTDFFKLYLATPAIFNEGWRPSAEKTPGAKLMAAVVGKPLLIGGFDMKPGNGKRPGPKPMHRAVPAGSVYYYQGSIDGAGSLHGASISDYGGNQGYGIVYLGNV